MVGNGRRTDIEGAQAVNMKSILINRGDPHGSDDTVTPDYTINHLEELLQYLP
jgi:FMN phosphatase YigB (HAD superfamily)